MSFSRTPPAISLGVLRGRDEDPLGRGQLQLVGGHEIVQVLVHRFEGT